MTHKCHHYFGIRLTRLIIIFFCVLVAFTFPRQQRTQHISPLYKYNLPTDSLKGEVLVDTSYEMIINSHLRPQTVRLVEKNDTLSDVFNSFSYEIRISLKSDTTVLQSFSMRGPDRFRTNQDITFTDANFDGYTDIQMLDASDGSGQNVSYSFYLFNPLKSCFELDSLFTAQFGLNTFIYPDKKEIVTGGVTGCAGRCSHFETFRLMNKEFTMVKRETTEKDESGLMLISTSEILENGKFVIVESDTTD